MLDLPSGPSNETKLFQDSNESPQMALQISEGGPGIYHRFQFSQTFCDFFFGSSKKSMSLARIPRNQPTLGAKIKKFSAR